MPDRPGRINSATVEHISSPRRPAGRVQISSEKNLDARTTMPDRLRLINSAAGEHIIPLPRRPARRVQISSEKNLEVLNLLIVMVTKFSGLVGLSQG
jgi:hypothetical protein